MSMRIACLTLAVCVLSCPQPLHAFDTQTHAYITFQGFLSSNLGNANAQALLRRLGLARFNAAQPFSPYWLSLPNLRDFYYDNLPSGVTPLQDKRSVTAYEWVQMRQLAAHQHLGPNGSDIVGDTPLSPLPIANWVLRGAIREDDLRASDYKPENGPPPDPDPHGDILRPLRHFYDPIHNIPLTFITTLGEKSVDWALGEVDSFASPPQIDTSRRNHFSWEDARNNEFLALTAERDASGDGLREAAEREDDSVERLFRWATTFRSLGDVVHLLQDAAQPQHTRNDRHDDHFNTGDRQGFEPFTNYRLIRDDAFGGSDLSHGQRYVKGLVYDSDGVFDKLFTPLPDINGYPVPMFTTPLRFFTTRAAGDGPDVLPDNRYGMADYSNRGFFTTGTIPGANTHLAGLFAYPRPDPTLTGFVKQSINCKFLPTLRGKAVTCVNYLHSVPDSVQPSRADATAAEPLLSDGMWKGFFGSTANQYTVTPNTFQVIGNLTIPRAIAYSAGLIDYFFRGQLDVTAPPAKIVGVLNQGAQHTMNAQGYPCVGATAYDGCPIFGFNSIRVNVKNATPAITESGTGTVVAQDLSSTVASPGPTDPQLVAVARYHRNTCYKPDLSGERVQSYAPPPQHIIGEPVCDTGQTVRTAYQEISVSSPAAVSAAELNGTSPVLVHFDFSADPIPVNATDLFIQVVYRGPMGDAVLGQEPDAIAVGMLDVREPTFVAFWNNTDYFWSSTQWRPYTSTYPNDAARDFWACAGGFPTKLVFLYQGGQGSPALGDPVFNGNIPGVVRLGFVFPPPDFATQRKSVRGVPVAYPIPGEPSIPQRLAFTSGQFRQANREDIPAATLTTPDDTCATALPGNAPYWCFDPIQQRRGQRLGVAAQPFYLEPVGSGTTPTDVDAAGLPSFAGVNVLADGTVRFDTDARLQSCPAQPSTLAQPVDAVHLHLLELEEQAAELGISTYPP